MKRYEALEIEATALRLVEGTKLDWRMAIRIDDNVGSYFQDLSKYSFEGVQLALKIVEGKPVFKGDTLYHNGVKFTARDFVSEGSDNLEYWVCSNGYHLKGQVSWNPPKPKTVMVELLVEDAKQLCGIFDAANIGRACKKALGELK